MDKTNVRKISSLLLEVLPYASTEVIKKEAGLKARGSVTKILEGEWTNEQVFGLAIKYIRERRDKMNELLELVDELGKKDQAA